jgi:hypothetical protein
MGWRLCGTLGVGNKHRVALKEQKILSKSRYRAVQANKNDNNLRSRVFPFAPSGRPAFKIGYPGFRKAFTLGYNLVSASRLPTPAVHSSVATFFSG